MPCVSTLVLVAVTVSSAGKGDESARAKSAGGGLAGATCTCVADFDSNGTIDGADLAALLGGWGSASHDLDGNGTTDGADLSTLLGGWGPCAATPENDLCANALPIFEGETPFCTLGAGTEVPPYPEGSPCNQFGFNSISSDVWFSYVATEDGTVTVDTCGATWDTRLATYANLLGGPVGCPSSSPGLVTLIACNDDFAPCANASRITFAVQSGLEYKIRVGGYLGWSGEGVLNVDFDPVGSSCDDPIDLGFIASHKEFEGSTLDADFGSDDSPCGLGDTAARWYRLNTSGCAGLPSMTVTTCDDGTDFDTVVSVWKAGAGECPGSFVTCNDDFANPDCQIDGFNRKSRVSFPVPTGGDYYIRVAGYNGAKGNFKLIIDWQCN